MSWETVGLGALAAATLLWPLWRPPGSRPDGGGDAELDRLEERRRTALAGLSDLEEELELGKLERPEYEALRRRYERQALEAWKELKAAGEDRAQTEGCPFCGGQIVPGDAFCRRCGQMLVRTCPACGAVNRADHRFCTVCGASLR